MICHHPDQELLFDYAAGVQPRALSLIVASHLSYCPACRSAVADVEALGGEVLCRMEPAPVGEDALEACLAKLDHLPPTPSSEPLTPALSNGLPAALKPFCPAELPDLPWQSVGGFFDEMQLPLHSPGFRISLIRAAAGTAVPEHGHEGNEFMLVLNGGFRSGDKHFRLGDFSACAGSEHHTPIADEGEDCVCLMVLDAPLVFRDPVDFHVGPAMH